MSSEDPTGRDDRDDESMIGTPQSPGRTDSLVKFVTTTGTQVAGRHRDKGERIKETVRDLELACEGAFSLAGRTAPRDRVRWCAPLARACSVFLRKMVIGDRNDSATRLLDDSVARTFGLEFDRLRRMPAERRTLNVGMSTQGGVVAMQKLDEATGRPEATVSLPIPPHKLSIAIEWPLPGATSWTAPPTVNQPWTMAPGELFELEGEEKLDCNGWLGQQLVMFDQRGITLKDVIRTVATYEGAHSINVSRLLQEEGKQVRGPFRNPERHILDNVTVFGMKYTHIVVIECALYLYEMLADGGHIERLSGKEWRLRPSFVTTEKDEFFSAKLDWLDFTGGMIPSIGTGEHSIRHSIRAVRK